MSRQPPTDRPDPSPLTISELSDRIGQLAEGQAELAARSLDWPRATSRTDPTSPETVPPSPESTPTLTPNTPPSSSDSPEPLPSSPSTTSTPQVHQPSFTSCDRDGIPSVDLSQETDPTIVSPPIDSIPILINDAGVTSTRRETLRELKRDLDKVNREASRILHAIRALQALDGLADTTPAEKGKTKGALAGLNYPQAAHLVLTKTHPMSVKQLLEQMAKGGCPVQTAKPYRTIYKVLRSHEKDLFERGTGSKWTARKETK